MEKRGYKVNIRSSGGNASKGALQSSISLPIKWVREMKITPQDREVELLFDGSVICIRKKEGSEQHRHEKKQ